MDSAEQIFQNFVKGGYAHLCQVRDEKRIETELIDFKTIKDDQAPMVSDDIRTLSKALSGFANSGGGVIVWGLDCRLTRGADEPDCVKELKPIKGLKRLMSDLNSRSPEVVDGSIIGVRHESLEEPDGSDSGFAFTYVPKGEGIPHQAQDKAFYYRSGSTFQKMPTWMVADRFGRNAKPELDLVWKPFNGDQANHTIILSIMNKGRASAFHAGFVCNPKKSDCIREFQGFGSNKAKFEVTPGTGPEVRTFCEAKPDTVLHPGIAMQAAHFLLPRQSGAVARLPYHLFCDGFSKHGVLAISAEDAQNFSEP